MTTLAADTALCGDPMPDWDFRDRDRVLVATRMMSPAVPPFAKACGGSRCAGRA